MRGHFNLWYIEERYKKIGLGWLYLLVKLPERLIALKRKKVFDKFYNKYIQTTTEEYHSIDELRNTPPLADCYIAGSDQIWNTTFKNGTDPGFYLDFGKKTIKRISYAASFATDKLKNNSEDFIKDQLKNFDQISVRESSGLKILQLLGFNGVQVVDPVFLLSSNFWINFASKIGENENYILIYDFEHSKEIEILAKRIAKLENLKIYSIAPYKLKYSNKNFINYDPTAFVSLIKNAKYIISNSFHGSAFAIIFQKNFFVVNREDGLNVRMRDLLSKYGLESRLITTDIRDDELLQPIQYNEVLSILNSEINFSQTFLNNSLK